MKNNYPMPYVSVVIAVKNEMGYIEECLNSLINQNYPKNCYEILIYDGQSNDGTKAYLEQMAKSNDNIFLEDNPKYIQAAAWNLGFKRSTGEFVIMMGAHSYVDPDFIKNNVFALQRCNNVPCVGGIVETIGKDEKSRIIACTFNSRYGVGNAHYRYAREECYVETINYGTYRKSMIDQIGPIDEKILRGQDWEFNFRLVQKFGKMLFVPSIRVYYYSRSNLKRLWKKQFDAGYWKVEIVRKHPSSLLVRHFIPFLFVLTILVLLLSVIIAIPGIYLILFLVFYITISLIVSIKIAIKNKIKNLSYLLLSFFVVHFAYGLGFLTGIFKFLLFHNRN